MGFSLFLAGESGAGRAAGLAPGFGFCCAAIVCGDMLIFHLARRFGVGAGAKFAFLRKAGGTAKIVRARNWFDRYGPWAIPFARQIPGVRMAMILVCGASRISAWRFALADLLGCVISVPIWLGLGSLAAHPDFGEAWAKRAIRDAGQSLALGACALGAAAILVAIWVAWRRRVARLVPG